MFGVVYPETLSGYFKTGMIQQERQEPFLSPSLYTEQSSDCSNAPGGKIFVISVLCVVLWRREGLDMVALVGSLLILVCLGTVPAVWWIKLHCDENDLS